MPKEIIHWQVARRAAKLLASGPFGPSLSRCPNGLRLGSVCHDILYYLRGDHPAGLKELPHRLHGSHGEDTFEVLRAQAQHMHARKDSPLPGAVFVGLASHIFADAALHPLVYHLTGNYYDPDDKRRTAAVRRHRALESLLDMIAAGGPEAVLNQSLRDVVNSLEGPLDLAWPAKALAGLAACAETQAKAALAQSLDTFCTLQTLARIETLARVLFDLTGIMPGSAREVVALFYAPQLWEQRQGLTGRIEYRNPATGQPMAATLAWLLDEAARRTAEFCAAQAPAIIARGELAETTAGPSLDMGLPGVPVTQARHFASRLIPAL